MGLKKTILGHDTVELADILQIMLLLAMLALFGFIALKFRNII